MSDSFTTKRVYRVDFGETLSLGNYQSIKPALSDTIEYDPRQLPEGTTEEVFRKDFKEKVRQDYFKLKEQMLGDFIAFAKQLKNVDIASKR